MKSLQYINSLNQVSKARHRASRGERVLGSLFPSRGAGWPGGWSQDRMEQVLHMRNWSYVAIHTICSKVASIMPNIAYVSHEKKPGKTTKASHRALLNLMGEGFDGSPSVTSGLSEYGSMVSYTDWTPDQYSTGYGGHSFLTQGEYRSKALSVLKPHEELEPLEFDHPLRRLVENPNPVDTAFDLFYELQMFEELCGVSYLWVVPNRWGKPCELWVIPSHWVWPRTGGGKYTTPDNPYHENLVQYYEIRPWGGMGSAGVLRFPPDEVIMMRWKSPLNKIDGYSKLAAGAQWIDSEESISKSRWSQFINQARPEFWVELGPGYEDPDDNRIARIESKFMAKIQGEYNYGKPVITPPGAKITPLSFSPTEMAYFQSEEQIRDMILSLFQVPKAAVGISEGMTYGSVLAVLASLCSNCLNPRLSKKGQDVSKHLASRWDETTPAWSSSNHGGRGSARRVRYWYDDCVPADPAQVNSDMQIDLANNLMTWNEGRALRGRKPYKFGGDDPMINGGALGVIPVPVNTDGKYVPKLADKIKPWVDAGQPPAPEGGMMGMGGEQGLENSQPNQANPQLPVAEPPAPAKSLTNGHGSLSPELESIVQSSTSLVEVIERSKRVIGDDQYWKEWDESRDKSKQSDMTDDELYKLYRKELESQLEGDGGDDQHPAP